MTRKSSLSGNYQLACLLLSILLIGCVVGIFLSSGSSDEELQIEVLAESPIEVQPPTSAEREDV